MYLQHFGLRQMPFEQARNANFHVAIKNQRRAANVLVYGLRSGESFVKITGEVGTGKTHLCRELLAELDRSAAYNSLFLEDPSLDPLSLEHALAERLGTPMPEGLPRHRVHKHLRDTLRANRRTGLRSVVIVDEAQAMPSSTLDRLRLLSNIEADCVKLLQVVLFGQPELDRRLARFEMRQLRQRITLEFQLQPLSRRALFDYVDQRLMAAGARSHAIFEPNALRALHRGSSGIPRLINTLGHKALLCAYGRGERSVRSQHVQRALRDTPAARGWKRISLAPRSRGPSPQTAWL